MKLEILQQNILAVNQQFLWNHPYIMSAKMRSGLKSKKTKTQKHADYDIWMIPIGNPVKLFVAFCSFFPCSLTVCERGRKQKSRGRQQKSSRADKQLCFP